MRSGAALVLAVSAALLAVGLGWRFVVPAPDVERAVAGLAPEGATERARVRHVVIPNGWRVEQIAAALDAAGVADGARFLRLATDPRELALVHRLAPRATSVEGYLLPGDYALRPGEPEESLVARMIRRLERRLAPKLRARAAALGLTIPSVVTLASVVEREAQIYTEKPVIAGVFLNRLQAGIPLQSDPTVIYALDTAKGTERSPEQLWRRRLTPGDTYFPSPYNTYLRKGLPPGPIANPSFDTIRSVLYPADVSYLYFAAKGDGSHAFSQTLGQHERNIERYLSPVGARPPTTGELQRLLERVASGIDGRVGIVVENLRTGERASVNADEYFTTASLYKLFVMDAAFAARRRGDLTLRERLTVVPKVGSLDLPHIRALVGRKPTVRHALATMIDVSSNAAGVTLLDRIGFDRVHETSRAQGLRNTFLSPARIITTPRDVARLLELIQRRRAVGRRESVAMLRLLLAQRINDRLPRLLPAHVRVAHKTGQLQHVNHDAGILFTEAGPILVVAMLEGAPVSAAASADIARLGSIVYRYFTEYEPAAARFAEVGNSACGANPYRPRAEGPFSGRTIVLDPGHGGRDSGAPVHEHGFTLLEKDLTLDLVLRLKNMLVARGATVYLTRCRDATVSLVERSAIANSIGADLFVSMHVNASLDKRVDGTELYYLTPQGNAVGNYLQGTFTLPGLWETLDLRASLSNGGVRKRRYSVLVYTNAPSALSESVYMTNPREARALRARGPRSRRQQIAAGHLRGILNYFAALGPTGAAPRPTAAPAPRRPAAVRIAATGDIALGPRAGPSVFAQIDRELGGDVVVGNLEGVIAPSGRSRCTAGKRRCFAFRAAPAAARWLRRAGFTVLSLANNHAHDFGRTGAASTVHALLRARVRTTGRPGEIALQHAGSVAVAVLGFAPDPGAQSLLDLDAARRLVREADARADVVVVTMHAGAEGNGQAHVRAGPETFGGEPRGDAVAFAHAVVEAGADLVVGHGPHVLRGMEWYRGRLIAYSLGNFAGSSTLSLVGLQSVGGILQVTLRADGSWVSGRVVSTRLTGGGTPAPDPAGAGAGLVRSLSRADFGGRAVEVAGNGALAPPAVARLTAQEKARLVVGSGWPLPPHPGAVLVQRWSHRNEPPAGSLVLADQEGGPVTTYPGLPPRRTASSYTSVARAFNAGRAAGRALRARGVDVDLAPVLDLAGGPLGSRHFRKPAYALAFARGLAESGVGSCVKHFPGLGTTHVSTDVARARGVLRRRDLAPFRAAIRTGARCVMVGHAVFAQLGTRPASLEPATYRLLRRTGFDGLAVTDDLSVLGADDALRNARLALQAGADLVLFTDGRQARRAVEALIPLARQGLLDDHVARVLALRHEPVGAPARTSRALNRRKSRFALNFRR